MYFFVFFPEPFCANRALGCHFGDEFGATFGPILIPFGSHFRVHFGDIFDDFLVTFFTTFLGPPTMWPRRQGTILVPLFDPKK